MAEFISRRDFNAIKRALAKLVIDQAEATLGDPKLADELFAMSRTGDTVGVRALLEARRDDLCRRVDDLIAAARAEIAALPVVVLPDAD